MAVRLVDPATNSLLVLYDDAQSIYQKKRREFNFSSVGIEARGRTSVLELNYRNTAEVLLLAVGCAERSWMVANLSMAKCRPLGQLPRAGTAPCRC